MFGFYTAVQENERVRVTTQGNTVLLIQSNPQLRRVWRSLFRKHGFMVETAKDPGDAVGRDTPRPYAFVIIDSEGLENEGADAVRQVRSSLNKAFTIVVGRWDEASAVMSMKTAGADACLPKPVKYGQILRLMESGPRQQDKPGA